MTERRSAADVIIRAKGQFSGPTGHSALRGCVGTGRPCYCGSLSSALALAAASGFRRLATGYSSVLSARKMLYPGTESRPDHSTCAGGQRRAQRQRPAPSALSIAQSAPQAHRARLPCDTGTCGGRRRQQIAARRA